jgi:hypothetical protein
MLQKKWFFDDGLQVHLLQRLPHSIAAYMSQSTILEYNCSLRRSSYLVRCEQSEDIPHNSKREFFCQLITRLWVSMLYRFLIRLALDLLTSVLKAVLRTDNRDFNKTMTSQTFCSDVCFIMNYPSYTAKNKCRERERNLLTIDN